VSSAPDFSADPLLEIGHVEVDEKTDPLPTESQLCHELGLVDWKNGLDRLHFDNHGTGNQQIHPISELERESVILDG
jgi:hypothetical protein